MLAVGFVEVIPESIRLSGEGALQFVLIGFFLGTHDARIFRPRFEETAWRQYSACDSRGHRRIVSRSSYPHILFACSKAEVHATRLRLTQSQAVIVFCIRLTNHYDPRFVVNLNCHGVTAKRAQPNVFYRLGFKREFPRTVLPCRLRAPVPQKELSFM